MPKVTAARIALSALIALSLTGCAAAAESDASGPQDAAPTAQSQPTETPEPLVAETPAGTDSDAAFLAYVRENLPPKTTIANATDAQLLAAGAEACERIESGESAEQMVLVEGEQPWDNGYYYDSANIITGARLHLCDA